MKADSEDSIIELIRVNNLKVFMAKRKAIDIVPLGLMLVGAYLLSLQNLGGWILVILGVYLQLQK